MIVAIVLGLLFGWGWYFVAAGALLLGSAPSVYPKGAPYRYGLGTPTSSDHERDLHDQREKTD